MTLTIGGGHTPPDANAKQAAEKEGARAMTMEKMLQVHDEVERQNAGHLKRYKLMEMHAAMVRGGQYEEARMVLRLLRRGYLRMGLDDVSWAVQTALENAGHPVWYSHNGNSAYTECEMSAFAYM